MKRIVYFTIVLFSTLQIVGCKSSKKQMLSKDEEEKVFSKINSGAYLKIVGNEPFWNIEISEDKIVYTPITGETVEFPYNIPALEKGTDVILYDTVNGKGTIQIRLTNQNCSDGMSDKEYNLKADVEIVQLKKVTKLSGCGYYFLNENLKGKWNLVQLKSKKVLNDENSVIPFLDFDSENNHVSGNAGCNGLSSTIELNQNQITFNEIILTRMFCENLTTELDFVNTLGEITSYKINGNTLNLYKGKSLEMVFQK